MKKKVSSFIITFMLFHLVGAQPTFKITLLDGTAKVQRSQKKNWENLSLGDEINDNDIVETFFQTKTAFQFGADNTLILGSNTRALCNIKEVKLDKGTILDVNVTLFQGGTLIKIASNSRASLYTSNAVAQLDSGTITTIVESKTGHTGFQVLGGKAQIRNVAQQQSKNLSSGLTTIVLPGKEPTAPLYITYRHVAVLKHFFGDDYVDRQIEEAGIQPTEDKTTTNRITLSQEAQANRQEAQNKIEKKLFSQNKIWGIILDDRARKKKWYEPILKPHRVHEDKGELVFNTSIGIAGAAYPKFSLLPSFYFPKFSIGLNLPLAKDADGKMGMHFSSAAGIFDKIHHMTFGSIEKSRFLHLGPIQNLTLARGLVVNNYQNKNIYAVTQPLGIQSKIENDIINLNIFISDITNWYVGGLHFGLMPGNTWLGVGYYYDANQYYGTNNSDIARFINPKSMENASIKIPKRDSLKSNTHIYELNFGVTHELSENISFDLLFQFARKMGKEGFRGYVIRGPEFGMMLENYNFGISYISEKGKMLEGYFSSMYMSNRLRYESSGDTLFYHTQNNQLSADRKSYGFTGFFRMKPFRGTAIDLSYRQDFLTRGPFTTYSDSGYIVDSTNTNNNFGYTLSLIINEKLLSKIKYAEIYFNQTHGGFYPKTGGYLASWGFNTGFHFMSAPLFFNLAFDAGLNFTYIDLYDQNSVFGVQNNNIDAGDNLIEFYIGIRWGFL